MCGHEAQFLRTLYVLGLWLLSGKTMERSSASASISPNLALALLYCIPHPRPYIPDLLLHSQAASESARTMATDTTAYPTCPAMQPMLSNVHTPKI
jgi:hypothetical protein